MYKNNFTYKSTKDYIDLRHPQDVKDQIKDLKLSKGMTQALVQVISYPHTPNMNSIKALKKRGLATYTTESYRTYWRNVHPVVEHTVSLTDPGRDLAQKLLNQAWEEALWDRYTLADAHYTLSMIKTLVCDTAERLLFLANEPEAAMNNRDRRRLLEIDPQKIQDFRNGATFEHKSDLLKGDLQAQKHHHFITPMIQRFTNKDNTPEKYTHPYVNTFHRLYDRLREDEFMWVYERMMWIRRKYHEAQQWAGDRLEDLLLHGLINPFSPEPEGAEINNPDYWTQDDLENHETK